MVYLKLRFALDSKCYLGAELRKTHSATSSIEGTFRDLMRCACKHIVSSPLYYKIITMILRREHSPGGFETPESTGKHRLDFGTMLRCLSLKFNN